jgi:flavin-dependent dehydrogenase
VLPSIEAGGFVRSTGNTVWWEGGGRREAGGELQKAKRVEPYGTGTFGLQVDRRKFDELLLDAAEGAGATICRDAIARDIERIDSSQLHRVQYDRTAGQLSLLDVRWVLDCSGRSGFPSRRGRTLELRGGRTLALVGRWKSELGWDLDDATHTLVESYEDGWAWSVPISPTVRDVTVMVDPTHTEIAGRSRLAEVYAEELDRTASIGSLRKGADLEAGVHARDASPYLSSRPAEDGRLLVGDAASFVDPLSSFGVKKAIASAWLAAVVARTCLTNEAMLEPSLQLFAEREKAMYSALQRRLAEMAREEGGGRGEGGSGFWDDRAVAENLERPDEPDVSALRQDAQVLTAFEEIRRRPSLELRRAPDVRQVARPLVRDDRVVVADHLVIPDLDSAVRYLRNVDLPLLLELAPKHHDVGEMYTAYTERAGSQVPLPDFLGVLSVLVAKRVLTVS